MSNKTQNVKWQKYYSITSEKEWSTISYTPGLTEDFIDEFADKVNWFGICSAQVLSEDFMRDHKDKISWQTAAMHQKMSESFIEENLKTYLSLQDVCYVQPLSEEFVHKHRKNIYWDILLDNKNCNFSDKFLKAHEKDILRYKKIYG